MPTHTPDPHRTAIKAFMTRRGLKAAPWCRRAKISEGTLRNYLNGLTTSLNERTLSKLAAAEGVSISEILGDWRDEVKHYRTAVIAVIDHLNIKGQPVTSDVVIEMVDRQMRDAAGPEDLK